MKKDKKSRNPIANIKDFIEEARKLSAEMKQANNDLDRIGRYSKNTV